ncbi:pantetheine-phosphate adenylyltransferase [Clostridium aciditolerans]|uniref:Phosphopantetheine adenylyltransferase n=1 Tax=Clostridium aciditolerans TaxID=339861 RepID=A0A934M4V5_9CLOT|nr:pantetheine-phosphate adenylyltransferase [Clostridium aciditolerans]MBI6874425.1 pantetheine-phosphate adenylyltransferase [Clostridium aciditolerans]
MTIAIYAGSFDPFTIGHLQVLTEASYLFDKVIVAIANNADKKRRIDSQLTLSAIEDTVSDLSYGSKIEVIRFEGLIADLANENKADYLIRGIRNGIDYEYEENLARINESFGLKTIYIRAGSLSHVSSSMVMELYKYGRDISSYVPPSVLKVINENCDVICK